MTLAKTRTCFILIMFMACFALLSISQNAKAQRLSADTITNIVALSGGDFDDNKYDYDILFNALTIAGLDKALNQPSANYTVFAPNDIAFIRLANDLGADVKTEKDAFQAIVGTLTLLGNGNPVPLLTDVLLYHVSPVKKSLLRVVLSSEIQTLLTGSSIAPAYLRLLDSDPDFDNPAISVRNSNIRASNGIIHTINRVLIPVDLPNSLPSDSIVSILQKSGSGFDRNWRDYDILLNAVIAANLQSALSDLTSNFTVFAPNDLAFIRLARSLGYRGYRESGAFNFIVDALTVIGEGDPIGVLTNVLLYHVSPGVQTLKDVLLSDSVQTLLEGAELGVGRLSLRDNDPGLSNPHVVAYRSDIRASNGIVHTINRVLIPVNITGSSRR